MLGACSRVCDIPAPGTYVLDEEQFVSALSNGNENAADEIRQAFFVDNEPSEWTFIDHENAIFKLSPQTSSVKLRADSSCTVTLSATTAGIEQADEVVHFRSTENGFCFTYRQEASHSHEECFVSVDA